MPDEIRGEIVAIAVAPVDGVDLDLGQLRTWTREHIRRESVPDRWFIVPEVPKTDRGKVNRQSVMEYCMNLPDSP